MFNLVNNLLTLVKIYGIQLAYAHKSEMDCKVVSSLAMS